MVDAPETRGPRPSVPGTTPFGEPDAAGWEDTVSYAGSTCAGVIDPDGTAITAYEPTMMYWPARESPFGVVIVAAGGTCHSCLRPSMCCSKQSAKILSLLQPSISFPAEPLSLAILSLHGGPEFLLYFRDIPSELVEAYKRAFCQLGGMVTEIQADVAGQFIKSLREFFEISVKVC